MLSFSMLRIPASKVSSLLTSTVSNRLLSTQCECSVLKLKQVFEDYRVQNYSQEMPSRAKKDIIKACASGDEINLPGLERVLQNIGASTKLSEGDLNIIFSELGDSGTIPLKRMIQIL